MSVEYYFVDCSIFALIFFFKQSNALLMIEHNTVCILYAIEQCCCFLISLTVTYYTIPLNFLEGKLRK